MKPVILVLLACVVAALADEGDPTYEVENLPVEFDDLGEEEVVSTTKQLNPIKQSDAPYAVAILNNEIIDDVVSNIGRMPLEIEIRPPEPLLSAKTGFYTVEVFVFTHESDYPGGDTEPKAQNYTVQVVDVDECTDKTLPSEWQQECHGRYTHCNNLNGTYECNCFAGTIGAHPCEGAVKSSACSHTCRDPEDIMLHRSNCEQEFNCEAINECAVGTDNCHSDSVCTAVDCEEFAGLKEDPPTCVNSYNCQCRPGFEGTGHGEEGCTNVDECSTGTHTCHKFANCEDSTPSAGNNGERFTCTCRHGFSGDGTTCSPAALCALVDEAGVCHSDATCEACDLTEGETDAFCQQSPRPEVSEGEFRCKCKSLYQGSGLAADEDGCVPIDYCTDPIHKHDCNEHAECNNLGEGQFSCECREGFTEHAGGNGPEGCINIDECTDFLTHDCHFGALCIDHVPSETNAFMRYDCKCKSELGWVDHSATAGFGPEGCEDATPPKAFLRCSETAKFSLMGTMHDVITAANSNEEVAQCNPGHEEQKLEKHGLCECPNQMDHYQQYQIYSEKGMIVKDDNANQQTGDLRQRIMFKGLPLEGLRKRHLMRPGEFPEGVRYSITPALEKGIHHSAQTQTWFRKVVVEPVDECTDTSLPEQFQHKCHGMASCVNTYESYDCACLPGYDCGEECDGFQLGYGAMSDMEGCLDKTSPVIALTGTWPVEVEECRCGSGHKSIPTPPTKAFMAGHGLSSAATDLVWDVQEGSAPQQLHEAVESIMLPPVLINCTDIPTEAPPGVIVKPFECHDDPLTWKVSYTAVDASGNEAVEVSHYIIQRPVAVLQRLQTLELFVAAYKEKNGEKLSDLEKELFGFEHSIEAKSSSLLELIWRIIVALLLLLAAFALYFGWIPLVIKMLGAICTPRSMSRNDFEEGYNLWLRISRLGFKGALDRARAVEEQWAQIEDQE